MAEAATSLSEELRRRIGAAGPLSVAEFMDAAVGQYYASGDLLGARGDFITSPEVSQVFGELIGLWCADLWQRMGAPDPVLLVELGPGRGTMLKDALRAIASAAPQFRAALRLHLIERSPALRAAQAQALAAAEPTWHDVFDAVPAGPMLLVANEFLDALPVRQFVRAGGEWRERLVTLAGGAPALEFTLADRPPTEAGLGDAPPGAIRELRPAARALARHVGARLATAGGGALFIDYGHEGGFGDTLQAVRRHDRHEVLADPGTADLSAHVDFGDFRAAAEAAGARAWGPVPQGDFLRALGIEARTERLLSEATDEAALLLRSGCRRLVDPAAMGRLFRVLALTAPDGPVPAGFA